MASMTLVSRLTARRCLYTLPRTTAAAISGASRSVSPRNYSTSPVVAASAGRHWYNERLVSVGLLAIIPTGLVYPNPVVDYSLALLVPLHGHWGLMAVVEDYMPEALKTPAKGLVYLLSLGTFAGLMYLNLKDVGICGAVRALWAL